MRTYYRAILLVGLGVWCAARPCRAEGGPCLSDGDCLQRLDRFLFGKAGAVPGQNGGDDATRAARYREYVRVRLADEPIFTALIRRLFDTMAQFENDEVTLMPFVLTHRTVDGKEIYYKDEAEPCAASDTVEVFPWWDLAKPIRVCKESYKPELEVDPTVGDRTYCESRRAVHTEGVGLISPCGCGTHLLNCARDKKQNRRIGRAMINEPIDTIRYVVLNHRRFSDILTMRDTVRSADADLFYARNELYQTGVYVPPAPDTATRPSLRPRSSVFGGGILTTPLMLWALAPARRIAISRAWEDFLCAPLFSTNVHAKQLFELSDPRLRAHAHMALAAMTGCRDCHARIENVLQATSGFPSIEGRRYVAADAFPGLSRFYVRDANDLRGEGPSTPLWIGQMMTRQPEFDACMVRKAERMVFGDQAVPDDLHQRFAGRFGASEDFATLIEDVIVGRFVGATGFAAPPTRKLAGAEPR